MPHLRSYPHTVFGLLLGELPVVVHKVLVYARQLQPGQRPALFHHSLLLTVHASHDLSCLSCVVAAISNVEFHDAWRGRTKQRERERGPNQREIGTRNECMGGVLQHS